MHGKDLLPFLKIGVTLASFQSSGIEPDCRDVLNKSVNGLTNSDFTSFMMRGEIVSGPGVLFTLSLSIHFDTSLSVILKVCSTSLLFVMIAGTVGMLLSSSVVNTEAKKLFRILLSCVSSLVDSPFSSIKGPIVEVFTLFCLIKL